MTTKGFEKKSILFSRTKVYRLIALDKNRLVSDSWIIANTFNDFFISITNTLNLKPSIPKSKSLSDLPKLYQDHLSVLKIKEKYKIQNKF